MNKVHLYRRDGANGREAEAIGDQQSVGDQHSVKCGDGPEPEFQSVWALIDPRPLIREALVDMINGGDSALVVGVTSAEDLVDGFADASLPLKLIILHVADRSVSQEWFCGEFALLNSRIDSPPIIVLSDRLDVNEVTGALRAGARGYIPTSWSLSAVVQALKHVEAGNIHVPAEAISHMFALAQDRRPSGNGAARRRNGRFTPRQLEVLHLLRQGKPNKIIAYELKMQESTVKVHVREIMKKLKVTNRTEAALRAGQLLAELDGDTETSGDQSRQLGTGTTGPGG